MLAAIDFESLGQVIWVSCVASICVSVLYSLVLYSGVKSVEARREGHGAAGLAYGALAVLAMLVFLGGLVLGFVVMLNK